MSTATENKFEFEDNSSTTAKWRHLRTEVKSLTRGVLEEFTSLPSPFTERFYKSSRVNYLKDKVETGKAIPFWWAIGEVKSTGDTVRLNGQHSSQMLAGLNGNFPDGLTAVISTYELDDEIALPDLFRQFDSRRSARDLEDISYAHQSAIPPLRKIFPPTAKMMCEGIAWYRNSVQRIPAPRGEDTYSLFFDENLRDFFLWGGDLITEKTPELKKRGVLGAMYGIFEEYPRQARAFFESVAQGEDRYEDASPSSVLAVWLLAVHNSRSKKRSMRQDESLRSVSDYQLYQGCVYAFHAFLDDKNIRDVKFKTEKGLHEVHR